MSHKRGEEVVSENQKREGHSIPSPSLAENASELLRLRREKILWGNKLSYDTQYVDPITCLTNRKYFYNKAFTVLKSKFNRENTHSILLLIDIADFKSINMHYGYANADECLKEVAVRLLDGIETIKGDVSLSRTGSNEFALLVGSLIMSSRETLAYANQLVDRINKKFELPVDIEGQEYQLKVHIGATFFVAKKQTIESMIHEASLALQAAKTHAHRSFCFFEPKMAEVSHFKTDLLNSFEKEADERVLLYYQPIMDRNLETVGYEVLARWQKDQNLIVSAGEFIPYLKESGHIVDFDKYVFEKVCRQLAEWEQDGTAMSVDFVSVNVSPSSFMRADFLLFVPKVIEKYGIDAKRIVLEITEDEFLSDFEAAERKMTLLKEYGVRFILDDYGTGYASLSCLYRLPLSGLKIDKSMIADIDTNENIKKIVSLIFAMAQEIGLTVVAEGVERETQRDILVSMGCNYFQGFLFDSPALLHSS